MYSVKRKKVGSKRYRTIKVFPTYDKAYSFIGNNLQVQDTLHWSYSCKYMMDGYSRKKLFPYGTNYLRRKNICTKIESN
jgi:hypothetical protein